MLVVAMFMQACHVYLEEAPGVPVRLIFSDFNRLRWAADALQVHPALRQRLLLASKSSPLVVDSVVLHDARVAPRAQPTHVVLWDGLNSLIELRLRRPDLCGSAEPNMLFVGQLPEAEAAMPVGAWPLYPRTVSEGWPWPPKDTLPRLPMQLRLQAWLRRRLRPIKQRVSNPALHQRMSAGGCAVFCGAIRHNHMLLEDSFRGAYAHLAALRTELDDLLDLPWDIEPERAQYRIIQAIGQLQRHASGLQALPGAIDASHGAAWACVFNVLNLLHRQFVLSLLNQRTDKLIVAEFGRERHFDPYDASAYRGNLFLDFGSTCGGELLYPRRLDIERDGKQAFTMRLMRPGQAVGDWLKQSGPEGFLRQASDHAHQVLRALDTLKALAREG